jgi:hypothetical protein
MNLRLVVRPCVLAWRIVRLQVGYVVAMCAPPDLSGAALLHGCGLQWWQHGQAATCDALT